MSLPGRPRVPSKKQLRDGPADAHEGGTIRARMFARRLARIALVVSLPLLAPTLACDDGELEQALRAEQDARIKLEEQLVAVEAERDGLQAELDALKGCHDKLSDSLLAYAKSEFYAEATEDVTDEAREWLEDRVESRKPDEKLAIVLDIDETTLSNITELERSRFCYQPKKWDAWVDTGSPPAVAGIKSLYEFAVENDVAVVFMTGRKEFQREDTVRALEEAGFSGWSELILRSEAERKVSAEAYKSARRAKLEEQGYTVIMAVGDQNSDIAGGHVEQGFLVPNPFYHID